MAILTADMKRVIAEQKLASLASVCADGTPNLSPKGTFLVLDDEQIMFGEMRSPNTVANLARNPVVELNFIDVFARKGYRFKGPARFLARETDDYARLLPRFQAEWGDLCELFNGIVVIKVERAAPLVSPAYDIGAKEEDLRQHWLAYFTGLQGP